MGWLLVKLLIISSLLCDCRYCVSGVVRFWISCWLFGCSWLELSVNSRLLWMLIWLLIRVMWFCVSGVVSVFFSVVWCCSLVWCCFLVSFSLCESCSCMLMMLIRISMKVFSRIDMRLLKV